MNGAIERLGKTLQSAYDEQYTDTMTAWREVGGKYKAENLLSVCGARRFSKVLDCGAGEGSVLMFLDASALFSELYAIEISESGIAQINRRGLTRLKEARQFNGYEIPYPDKHFGLAYCSHVIEHVEHPRLLLRELRRVSEFQAFEVPLDYSVNIDCNVQHFLSYGHINVYTPALFKFLLKSEGYEIVAEKLTHTAQEVVRFNSDRNMSRGKTLYSSLKLKTIPLRNALKRIVYGKRRYEEYGYSAYTCLARGVGELRIF
jgi:ubiquinone/menaquinone biosynthesis C-methylase UbiE